MSQIKIISFLFSFILLFFSFPAVSKSFDFENSQNFTDSFIQTVFELENWQEPELFFDEVKPYFDFHIIGRKLLGLGYRDFSNEEFNAFVEVFPLYEFNKMLSHLENIKNQEIEFIFERQREKEIRSGVLFKLEYRYERKSADSSNNNSQRGNLSFDVIKMKNQDHYKIINLSLNGANWLVQSRRYYNSLIERGKTPAEIINILKSE